MIVEVIFQAKTITNISAAFKNKKANQAHNQR